jgi:hypothetical protein
MPSIFIDKEVAHQNYFPVKARVQSAADQGRMPVGDAIKLLEDQIDSGWSFRRRNSRIRKKDYSGAILFAPVSCSCLVKALPEKRKFEWVRGRARKQSLGVAEDCGLIYLALKENCTLKTTAKNAKPAICEKSSSRPAYDLEHPDGLIRC